jgi:hypothetical protein
MFTKTLTRELMAQENAVIFLATQIAQLSQKDEQYTRLCKLLEDETIKLLNQTFDFLNTKK